MPGHGNAPSVLAGLDAGRQHLSTLTRRRRPPYARQFKPDENRFAIVCVGWPSIRPPAENVLTLPPDAAPAEIDWRILRGLHIFVMPAPGAMAQHALLRGIGAELAKAGIESLVLFDGSEVVSEYWRASSERLQGARYE